MKEKLFIDTSFWIALMDNKDTNHQIIIENLSRIIRDYSFFTSEFILFETITYLNCSIKNHSLAINFLNKIEKDESIIVLDVDSNIKTKGMNLFKEYSDKHLSFVDCTSISLMKEKRIEKYAGFDSHFSQVGFIPIL